jgi:photosystem II stability/assembly factor-like uncharacterized protein
MKKIIFLIFFLNFVNFNAQWVQQVSPVNSALTCIGVCTGYYGNYSCWLGGVSGIILKTSNSGTNWGIVQNTFIGTNTINCICGITQYNALVSITTSTSSSIYKTSNGGTNWYQVLNLPSGDIKSIRLFNRLWWGYPLDTNILFAVGNPIGGRWSLWKSTNGGSTWDSSGMFLPQNNSETSFYNSSLYTGDNYPNCTICFGTNNSRIYYSSNNGTNWSFGIVNGLTNINSFYLMLQGGFSADFAGGTASVKTTNYGQTWNLITLPGTGDFAGFFNAYYGNRYIYARNNEIYESTDYGMTFALTNTTVGQIRDMNFRKAFFEGGDAWGWAVTETGKIYYYNHVFADVKKISTEEPTSFSLHQNYPNPFNPSTKIKFAIPLLRGGAAGRGVFTKLIVYDILGKQIASLVNQQLQPGTYEVEWDGSNYPSGVYFYTLIYSDFIKSKKMILLK